MNAVDPDAPPVFTCGCVVLGPATCSLPDGTVVPAPPGHWSVKLCAGCIAAARDRADKGLAPRLGVTPENTRR